MYRLINSNRDDIKVLEWGNLLLFNGKAVLLTLIDFDLLLVLAVHLNAVLSTKEIYRNLWNKENLNVTSFTMKTHVSNLRKKLREASNDKLQLHN